MERIRYHSFLRPGASVVLFLECWSWFPIERIQTARRGTQHQSNQHRNTTKISIYKHGDQIMSWSVTLPLIPLETRTAEDFRGQ